MKIALLIVGFTALTLWTGVLGIGLMRGQVLGPLPPHGKWSWLVQSDHKLHFCSYTLLHLLMYLLFAWAVFGLWNTPAF